MNRNERAKAAQDTLTFFKQGSYQLSGKTVKCASTYDTEFIEDFLLMLARGVILDWILNEGKYDLEEKMWSNISAASPLFAA